MLIPWPANYLLGNPGMDATHAEFAALVNRFGRIDDGKFPLLFDELLHHTADHFAREEALMFDSGFPALEEHRTEHRRVLGDLRMLEQRVTQGRTRMAKQYLREIVPGWFAVHAATMDSALAAHLTKRENAAVMSLDQD